MSANLTCIWSTAFDEAVLVSADSPCRCLRDMQRYTTRVLHTPWILQASQARKFKVAFT